MSDLEIRLNIVSVANAHFIQRFGNMYMVFNMDGCVRHKKCIHKQMFPWPCNCPKMSPMDE